MATIPPMHIGERIAIARKRAGMTPEELAKALGITASAVRSWELGKSQPRPSKYPGIAEALGAHLGYIGTGTEPVMLNDDPEALERRATQFAELVTSLTDEQIELVMQVAREFQKVP